VRFIPLRPLHRALPPQPCVSFYLFNPTQQIFTNTVSQVSSDAAISIAFGLISTIIGLIGAIINYLTLRAMAPDIGTPSPPSFKTRTSFLKFVTYPSLHLFPNNSAPHYLRISMELTTCMQGTTTTAKIFPITSKSFDTNTLSSFPSPGVEDESLP
jgi:hypothetical protein